VRINTPVEVEYYGSTAPAVGVCRNGGTAKRAHGAKEIGEGSVSKNLPEIVNLREVFFSMNF
jgi:hypothetical protein